MNRTRIGTRHQMVAFVLGLFLTLGLAVLPALSSPTLPAYIRMPTVGSPSSWTPIAALVAGIVILMVPKAFHYVVAVYLIMIGLVGLLR